jgi:hypothetical protein
MINILAADAKMMHGKTAEFAFCVIHKTINNVCN